MEFDSQSTKPSSSIVGTRPFGFLVRYSGVFTTPNGLLPFDTCPPGPMVALARMKSNLIPISSSVHNTFCVRPDVGLPQSFSIMLFAPLILVGFHGRS